MRAGVHDDRNLRDGAGGGTAVRVEGLTRNCQSREPITGVRWVETSRREGEKLSNPKGRPRRSDLEPDERQEREPDQGAGADADRDADKVPHCFASEALPPLVERCDGRDRDR
jgi:hypothetical protein